MVVLMLEHASTSLRGELTRWLIEPRAGVFVGQVSAMVRDRLWEKAIKEASKTETGGAMLIYSSPTEQGFLVRCWGDTRRDIRDWDGLQLVYIPKLSVAPPPKSSSSSPKEES